MASGSAVSLDTVMISIESDAGKATSSVDKLSSSLNTLKDSMSGGFGNLKKLATYLNDLRSSTKGFGSVTKNIENITTGLAPLKELSNIPAASGLKGISDTLKDIPTIFSKINPDVLSNVSRVSNRLSEALTPLADKLVNISNGFNAISKLADKYGVSVTKIYNYTKRTTSVTKTLGNAFKIVGNAVSKVTTAQRNFLSAGVKQFENLRSKIKQVALSLLGTRTLFTMLRKAVSEYMAMDEELTKYTTNVWRAFGAQLAPAIEYAMYLFKQFVRVIYSVVLALTGIDLISRANQKAMAGWGKSAKDTLGSLQKFDDLNVVEFNKNSGSGDENDLINLDTIDLTPFQKIIDWVKKLKKEIKDALDTGEWYNVGKVFGEGINDGVNFLLKKLPEVENKLKEVAAQFAHFLNGAIETVHWDNIGELITEQLSGVFDVLNTFFSELHWSSIGKSLDDLMKTLNPVEIINSMGNMFTTLAKGISTALLEINTADIGVKISDSIIATFKNLDKILNAIPWADLGDKVHDAIVKIDWKEIIKTIGNFIVDVFSSLGTFVASALFGKKFMTKSKSLWIGIGSVLGGIFAKNLASSLLSGVGNLIGNLGKLGGLSNVLKGTSSSKGSSDFSFKIPNVNTVLTGLADLALIIGATTIFLAVYDELTKEPGFQKALSGGLDTLVKVFSGIGKVIIPIGVISGIVAGLGTLGFTTALSGLGGLALVIAGVPAVVAAVGLLLGNKYVKPFISGGIDTITKVFKGLSDVALPIAAFSALLVGLGFATPKVIGLGALGFAEVIGTVGLVVAALGGLSQIDGFAALMNDGGNMFMKLGEIIGGFAGSIIKGFVGKSFEGLDKIADSLVSFSEKIKPFFSNANNLNKDTAQSVKYLAEAVLAFTASGLFESLTKWFSGDTSTKIVSFGEQLEAFGPHFAEFAKSVKDVDGSVVEKAANAATSVAEFAKKIPNNGGVLAYLIGDNMLSLFGLELKLFGPWFAAYAKSVKDIDANVVKNSASAAKSLTEFAKEVPNQGGLLASLIGLKSLSLFGLELAAFGPLFKTYYDNVKNIKSNVVKNSADAAESLTNFAKQVPSQGGFLSSLINGNTLSSFGTQLALFGPKFKSYYNDVKAINTAKLDSVTDALGTLIQQYSIIKDKGLAQVVSSFGAALKSSASDIKSFFNNALPNNRGWDIGYNFGAGIASGIVYAIKHTKYPDIRLSSDSMGNIAKFKMSALATGTNYIPQEGPYYLHKGESVVPKKYNPAVGGGTNEETNRKLDALIDAIDNMSFTNVVNIGNETMYKKNQRLNERMVNKYGTINL